MSLDTSNICYANSLVGVMTMMPVPFFWVKLLLYSSSNAGIRNASVLPDPVLAAPNTSLPLRRCGIVLAWMWVINEKLIFSNAFLVGSHNWKSVNFLSDRMAVFVCTNYGSSVMLSKSLILTISSADSSATSSVGYTLCIFFLIYGIVLLFDI